MFVYVFLFHVHLQLYSRQLESTRSCNVMHCPFRESDVMVPNEHLYSPQVVAKS